MRCSRSAVNTAATCSSHSQLDQPRAFLPERGAELAPQRIEVLGARRFHALRPGKRYPVQVRAADLQHVAGPATGFARAHVPELALEDLVSAVGEDDGGDVEVLARH